jgi:hypothetical protein
MVEPEQTSSVRQRLGNVSAATNINEDYFPLQRIAANGSLPGSKLNEVIPVTTQNNRGTAGHGDLIPAAWQL